MKTDYEKFDDSKNTIFEKNDIIDMFEDFKKYYVKNNYDSYTHKGRDENGKEVNKLFEKGKKFYSKI